MSREINVVVRLIATTILTSDWVREDAAYAIRDQRLDRIVAVGLFGAFAVGMAILLIPVL